MSNEPSEEDLATYKLTFSTFDKDGSGSISASEFGTVMTALGESPTQPQIQATMRACDLDGNETIDFDEFLTLMTQNNKNSEYRAGFRIFDTDKNGFITPDELRDVMKSLGNPLSDEEMDTALQAIDENKDGKLNYEEFMLLMKLGEEE